VAFQNDVQHAGEGQRDTDQLRRTHAFFQHEPGHQRNHHRRARVDQGNIGGHRRARAHVDEGAADPHTERAKNEVLLPLASDRNRMRGDFAPRYRTQQQERDQPAAECQRVRRDGVRRAAADQVVDAPQGRSDEDQGECPLLAMFGSQWRAGKRIRGALRPVCTIIVEPGGKSIHMRSAPRNGKSHQQPANR
jgi:hypothetical protein